MAPRRILYILFALALGCATGLDSDAPGPDAGGGQKSDEPSPMADAAPQPDAEPTQLPCTEGSTNTTDPITGHCLMLFSSTQQPWEGAEAACSNLPGSTSLAVIQSDSENELFRSLVGGNEAWIGGNDRSSEGTFVWVDGGQWVYDNWRSGEPNNNGNEDCVILQGNQGGKWDDRPCAQTYRYLCERQ